jgi:predicted  nucleic acid-binding Zn-ribbon protein
MSGVSIESLMFAGIGFCLAWLIALMVLPAVHKRAMRLARKRYDDLPLSIQEIRAEKDSIRAGFAAATRDLEIQLERLRDKTVAHANDVAKKNQLIDRLKQEIGSVTASLRDSETREEAARDALHNARRGFAGKVTPGTAEGEIGVLKQELAAREAGSRAIEKGLAEARAELAGKDAALAKAEKDITAIRAEITALTKLLVETGGNSAPQTEMSAATRRGVGIVPFAQGSRAATTAHRQVAVAQPAQDVAAREPLRAPVDLVAAPTRLIPPTIPQGGDSVGQALKEIADAARRVDERA